MQVGHESGQVRGQDTRRHDEHARVPQVALGHVAGSSVRIGLFDELGDPAGTPGSASHPSLVLTGQSRSGRDVAVGGRGLGGRQPNRHDVSVARGTNRGCNGGAQQLGARNQVVGGERADDGIVPKALAHDVGGQSDRGHGIAPRWLDEERTLLRGSELGKLGEYAIAVRLTGHDGHGRGRRS